MRTTLLTLALVACATASTAPVDSDTDVVDTAPDVETDVGDDKDIIRACILESWVATSCNGCHFYGGQLPDLVSRGVLDRLRTTERDGAPQTALVVEGDPDASFLVRKLEARVGLVTLGEGEGDPMPLDMDIDAADAQLVRDWVQSGAPDCNR